jgi:hypothetical protein
VSISGELLSQIASRGSTCQTLESSWRRRCRDDLAAVQCRGQVTVATTLPRQLGHGAMSMPSHAGDGAAEMTWPRRDVDAHANMTPSLICV